MKKILLGLLLSTGFAMTANAADAYVGGSVDFLHSSVIDTALVGVVGGVHLTENIAVEAKLQQAVEKKGSAIGDTGVTLFTAGVVGKYPLTEQLYARSLVGATWARFDSDLVGSINSDPALTLGAGLGLNVTKNVSVEANYTFADVRGTAQGVTDSTNTNQYGLTVKYNF